ncbi:hypothetical protein D3C77_644680 [compost metagenome]
MVDQVNDRYLDMQIVDWLSGVGALLKGETFQVRGAWHMLTDTRLKPLRGDEAVKGRELKYNPKGYHARVDQLNEQYRQAK